MAESSLSLARTDLRTAIARFLDWDPDEDDRAAAQNTRLTEIERSGLRQFYTAHDWQFNKVLTGALATEEDDWQYDAPDDLAYIVGDITIDDEAEYYPPIRNMGEEYIRRMRQADDTTTGVPQYFGLAPKAWTGVTGQRWEIQFYPTPNDAYDLTYLYAPQGTAMTEDLPYPRGGAMHAETVKASCLAVAEREINEIAEGPEWQNYQRLLGQSIRRDKDLSPRNWGYNADKTEGPQREKHVFDWEAEPYP